MGWHLQEQWYYAEASERVGPVTAKELQRLIASAERWDILVWRPGLSGWTRAGDVPELQGAADRPPLPSGAEGFSSERNDNFREKLKYSTRGIVGAIVLVGILIFINSHPSSPTFGPPAASISAASNSGVSCNPWPAKCDIPVQDVTELVDWHWRPEPAFASTGAILWDVKIRNTSSQNMGWVQVKFFAYDENGNYATTDDATVFSIPPGETRSAKGYADMHGTEATATVQLQEFLFVAEDMTAGLKLEDEEKTADEMLAFRKLNHFCRVEQALKDKVAITAKSLKQRWPQDQDCRDGYELHACFQQVSDDWVRKSSAFMDSCKQKGTADQCIQSIGASPLLSEATAAIKRCEHLTYHH